MVGTGFLLCGNEDRDDGVWCLMFAAENFPGKNFLILIIYIIFARGKNWASQILLYNFPHKMTSHRDIHLNNPVSTFSGETD